jgi:putative flippase GtrA
MGIMTEKLRRHLLIEFYQFINTHKVAMLLFASVGALSALTNFMCFTLFWKLVGLNYQLAVSIAYVISVLVHYIGNRNLTFKSTGENNLLSQLAKYLMLVIFNYCITLIVMHITVKKLLLSPFLGIIFAIGVTVMNGYLLSYFWIFRSE